MHEVRQAALCYLATPYSKFPDGIEAAFHEAAKISGDLMCAGISAYSPIVHSHPVAIACGLDPLDHTIWLPANQAMMNVCDTLIVATMESWEKSYGIAHELDWYRKKQRKIFWLDPVTMVMTREREIVANKQFKDMNLSELESERSYWDGQIRNQTQWGASLAAADEFRDECDKWIRAHKLAHGKTPSQHSGTSE